MSLLNVFIDRILGKFCPRVILWLWTIEGEALLKSVLNDTGLTIMRVHALHTNRFIMGRPTVTLESRQSSASVQIADTLGIDLV